MTTDSLRPLPPEDWADQDEEVLVITAIRTRHVGDSRREQLDDYLERMIDHMLKLQGYWARVDYRIKQGTQPRRTRA